MSASLTRNPAVLIHGIDDTAACLAPLTRYLVERGWSVSSFDLTPSNGDAGIPELAGQLKAHIDTTYPAESRVDLVGFSLGGMVSRYYLQRLGGLARVQRFVTISTPHHGTLTGYLRLNIGGTQLRPGSALYQDLNRDVEELRPLTLTSIWTPLDIVIIPATSCCLPFGRDVRLPVLFHASMLRDARSLAAVAAALTEG